jgi:hypothetical protein
MNQQLTDEEILARRTAPRRPTLTDEEYIKWYREKSADNVKRTAESRNRHHEEFKARRRVYYAKKRTEKNANKNQSE